MTTKKELLNSKAWREAPDNTELFVEVDSLDIEGAYCLHPVKSILYLNTPHELDKSPIPTIILARWTNN